MENKQIYIIQMHTNTIPSKIVKHVTRYKYSHVAISFTKDCDTIYSFGRKSLDSILKGGFVMEHKDGAFFQRFNDTICRIYEINITNEQYNKVKKIILQMQNNSDYYKYDFVGIVLRLFKIPISFKNKYVCSYFVADLLDKAGIYKFDKKNFFVQPKDFENFGQAKELYEGQLLTVNLM